MVKIQWYPGHMEKARRQMTERLKACDMVIELRDARIPQASMNPLLKSISQNKPRVILLTKCDLADPVQTKKWTEKLRDEQTACMEADLLNDSRAARRIINASLEVMKEKREKQLARGIRPRAVRAMAAGIPNVGKSTMINRIIGKKTLKAEDRPGVTRSLTWIHADPQLDLLDTPGVLWPKFDDEFTGTVLAACGSISDDITDVKMLAMDTIRIIQELYPSLLEGIYESSEVNPNGMLKAIARKRNLVKEDGAADTKRAAELFLNEFRKGKLGRISLEHVREEAEDMHE